MNRTVRYDRVQLSQIDVRILELAADGLTYRDIAPEVGRTENAVKTRVKRLLDRLGADSMPQAIAMSFRRGIIR